MFEILVIGGGPAGVTAALRAAELGAQVALVERGRLGGTCTNDGCVPTRVLAHAARLRRDAEQFAAYGLSGAPPQVDFARVLSRTQKIVYQVHEKKQLVDHLERSGVSLYSETGEASFSDPQTLLLGNGERLQADKFIIAAGGHARRLSFPGSEYTLTHSDVWSLNRLPASIVVVGGAATGSQLASIFSAFGAKVWLLELGPALLGREDPILARAVEDCFRSRGIEVITGIGRVERIEKRGEQLDFYYTDQDDSKLLSAEAVVMATGWPGNAELLNLGAANVDSERGYIQVNDYLQTSAEHIFAAGDITGRMMLVQSASYEARVAAENAVLGVGQPQRHLIVPHGGFTDPEYGSVGLTEEQARAAHPDPVVAVVPYKNLDRAVVDGHNEGYCKLIVSRENHRMLGAHVVGEQALEIVHLVASGMAADMWVEQLAELEIAYPTYTAILGLAARQIAQELGVVPMTPEWRSLGGAPAAEWERHGS